MGTESPDCPCLAPWGSCHLSSAQDPISVTARAMPQQGSCPFLHSPALLVHGSHWTGPRHSCPHSWGTPSAQGCPWYPWLPARAVGRLWLLNSNRASHPCLGPNRYTNGLYNLIVHFCEKQDSCLVRLIWNILCHWFNLCSMLEMMKTCPYLLEASQWCQRQYFISGGGSEWTELVYSCHGRETDTKEKELVDRMVGNGGYFHCCYCSIS